MRLIIDINAEKKWLLTVLRIPLMLMRIRVLNQHWIISFFLTAISLVLRAEDFSLALLVDILPLGSESVDPHYF